MSSHLSKLVSPSEARGTVPDVPNTVPSERKAALRAALKAHSVKRALAAVVSASDADYEAFGWKRGDLVARLRWLRDEIERPRARHGTPAAVTLARGPDAMRSAA